MMGRAGAAGGDESVRQGGGMGRGYVCPRRSWVGDEQAGRRWLTVGLVWLACVGQ
jgi:hypothetical protein